MGVGKTVSNSRCFFVVLPLLGEFLPEQYPRAPAPAGREDWHPWLHVSGVCPRPPLPPRLPPRRLGLAWEGFQSSS